MCICSYRLGQAPGQAVQRGAGRDEVQDPRGGRAARAPNTTTTTTTTNNNDDNNHDDNDNTNNSINNTNTK